MANDGMGGINGDLAVTYGPSRNDAVDTTPVSKAGSASAKRTNDVGSTVNPANVGGNRD